MCPGWEGMSLSDAAEAVQGSTFGDRYAQWEPSATRLVDNNQDAPPIALPWRSGGGTGALTCTSIPSNPALGEAGRNPLGSLDIVGIQGPNVQVVGWAFDPDAINGINVVHFYDYGPYGTTGYPTGVANQPRDDVDRAFNVVGQFGFTALLPWTGSGPPPDLRLRHQRRSGHRELAARLPESGVARAHRFARHGQHDRWRRHRGHRLGR